MPEPAKKWTVMVYLAGDNDLDSFGVSDLNEMKVVGSDASLNLVAQFDRAGAGEQTRRFHLRRGTPLDADVIEELGETNMGDPGVLQSFLDWAVAQYPAQHYLLVLWNHGAGWSDEDVYRRARSAGFGVARRGVPIADATASSTPTPKRRVSEGQVRAIGRRAAVRRPLFSGAIDEGVRKRAIAFDDEAQDFLDNVEMKKVLTRLRKKLRRNLDLLGMDACLMNMVEVAYQVRGCVDLTVGSEEIEPGDGWPYDKILKRLAANPAMDPAALGKVIVEEYLRSYGAASNVTQSVLDLAGVEGLRTAMDRLAAALRPAIKDPLGLSQVMLARARTQHYETREYIDLMDLCAKLRERNPGQKIIAACGEVEAAVGQVVIANGWKGSAVARSAGISVYWPEDRISPTYARLDFTRKSKWDEFLAAYLKATRG